MNTPYRFRPLPVDDEINGPKLILTDNVIGFLDRALPKRIGRRGHENVAYVAGLSVGDDRHGFAVIMPPAVTGPQSYDTDTTSHAAVMMAVADLNLEIVGQIHTHPGSGVYHSDGDDDLAFVKGEGFWSIVVPDYACRGCQPLSNCGFHIYRKSAFHLLTPAAVRARVSVMPTFTDLRS